MVSAVFPPRPVASPLVLPLALTTTLIGLFLIVSRRTAIMQVVGYLVLENGVFIFGVALAQEDPRPESRCGASCSTYSSLASWPSWELLIFHDSWR